MLTARRTTSYLSLLALTASLLLAVDCGRSVVPRARPSNLAAGTSTTLPSHAGIVTAMKRAADYYRPTFAHTALMPRNGWSWATYFQGVLDTYRQAGDSKYMSDGLRWGQSTAWAILAPPAGHDPDSLKAAQTYHDLHAIDPAVPLTAVDVDMAHDVAGLPVSQYFWIDALFTGLPTWTRWATRTGNAAYLTKMDAQYVWTRDLGATSSICAKNPAPRPGLYDTAQHLWYRDCRFVAARDAHGDPVFWSRGNGWVIASMAQVLQTLPAAAHERAMYVGMLQTLAARLAPLQGSDGFWRPSLLDPTLYPQPETSGTALITSALAYGISAGLLDAARYLPVVARAWAGLTTAALQPSGFVTDCQSPDVGPAIPYTAAAPRIAPTSGSAGTVNTDAPPFCVGAFLLAGSAVAHLAADRALGRRVVATSQITGGGVALLTDGDVTTHWIASGGFPQTATIDLGAIRSVSNTMLVPYQDRAYRYSIQTSTDNIHWQTVVNNTSNTATGSHVDTFTTGPIPARWVRLTLIGGAGATTTAIAVKEFGVYT